MCVSRWVVHGPSQAAKLRAVNRELRKRLSKVNCSWLLRIDRKTKEVVAAVEMYHGKGGMYRVRTYLLLQGRGGLRLQVPTVNGFEMVLVKAGGVGGWQTT